MSSMAENRYSQSSSDGRRQSNDNNRNRDNSRLMSLLSEDDEEEKDELENYRSSSVVTATTPHIPGGIGKPQVWVRLRPSPKFDDNIFEIGEDGTTLRLLVDPKEDRLLQRMMKDDVIREHHKFKTLTFKVDGILRNSSQEETYSTVVDDVISKGMAGTSGIIILIGPEVSGKSFTLFGYSKKYEYRGIIPRALERVFQVIESKQDKVVYKIELAIVEIRQNRIKDLLTMGTSEIVRIGKNGPQGLYYKGITSVEEGLSLLMLALSGQKGIPREEYAKYHTIVYLDIHGETSIEEGGGQKFNARITFSKIASMPNHSPSTLEERLFAHTRPAVPTRLGEMTNLRICPPSAFSSPKPTPKLRHLLPSQPSFERVNSCCLIKSGSFGEAIDVRRDLFLLEQMFIRSNELRKLNRFYTKVERMGMLMLMKRPNPAPSQYFRQCKLAHCLQDIVSGTTEIRIVLTIRPEKQYLHSTLEAMRFAQKVKCVPIDIHFNSKSESVIMSPPREPNPEKLKEELFIIHEEEEMQQRMTKSPSGLSDLQIRREKPSLNRQRIMEAQDFLEGRTEEIKIANKEQVKAMFETIRQMWIFSTEHEWRKKQLEIEEQQRAEAEAAEKERAQQEEQRQEGSSAQRKSLIAPIFPSAKKKANKSVASSRSRKRLKTTRAAKELIEASAINSDTKIPESVGDKVIRFSLTGDNELNGGRENNVLETIPEEKGENEEEEEEAEINENLLQLPIIEVPIVEDFKPVEPPATRDIVLNIPNIYTLMGEKEPSTKEEAWIAFLKTIPGLSKFEELSHQNTVLLEQSTLLQEISTKIHSVLTNLTQLGRAFNGILEETTNLQQSNSGEGVQQILPTADETNATSVLVPSEKEIMSDIKALESGRDDLVEKMNIVRTQGAEQKKIVALRKSECEHEFKKFCLERFGMTFEKGEPIIPVSFSEELAHTSTNLIEQEEIAKNYEYVRKNADKQAKALLRWFYSSRPAWYSY